MRATADFTGDQQTGGTEKGQIFSCPDCNAEVQIRNSGALFMGGIITAFWLAVAYWAFLKGPYWYAKHAEFLYSDGFVLSFFLMDVFVMVLSLGTMALSAWLTWTFLISPIRDRVRNPIIGESRIRSKTEKRGLTLDRRNALLAFFVFPLFLWVPLLAAIWGLDAVGFDMSDNGVMKNSLVFGLIGLIYFLARRFGSRAYYAFVGMAFWLAVIVTVIFTLG